jgi:hypothetical protein
MVEPTIDESQWDVFISYASEDRQALVEPLVSLLAGMGLSVWWDQFELTAGDSLIEKITLGLSRSRYGVVVLSHDFLDKPWPQYELQGLTARDIVGDKVVLPIWYDIGFDDVLRVNPPLAQKKAIPIGRLYERRDLVGACLELLKVARPDLLTRLHRRVAHEISRANTRPVKVGAADVGLGGPPRHDALPDELIRRIRLVRAALLSAYPHTMEFWVDGFIRDAHPSREVSHWERIAAAYLEYMQVKEFDEKHRPAIVQFLVGISVGRPVDEEPLPDSLEPDRDLLAALVGSTEPLIEFDIPGEPVWADMPTHKPGCPCEGEDSPPSHVEDFDETLNKEHLSMLVDYFKERGVRLGGDASR